MAIQTAYDVHGLLDYMLVEAVVENRDCQRRFTIPYRAVLPNKPEYLDAKLIVEINVYWDAHRSEHERETKPVRANTIKTRH